MAAAPFAMSFIKIILCKYAKPLLGTLKENKGLLSFTFPDSKNNPLDRLPVPSLIVEFKTSENDGA